MQQIGFTFEYINKQKSFQKTIKFYFKKPKLKKRKMQSEEKKKKLKENGKLLNND